MAGVTVNGEKLKWDIINAGIQPIRLAKLLGLSESFFYTVFRENRVLEANLERACEACDLDPANYIVTSKKEEIVKSKRIDKAKSANFEEHIEKLNDLGAIQAETLKVLTEMRSIQEATLKELTRMREEMVLQTQIMLDSKTAIQQFEKSTKEKTEKIYNYLKYPSGHSMMAVK